MPDCFTLKPGDFRQTGLLLPVHLPQLRLPPCQQKVGSQQSRLRTRHLISLLVSTLLYFLLLSIYSSFVHFLLIGGKPVPLKSFNNEGNNQNKGTPGWSKVVQPPAPASGISPLAEPKPTGPVNACG
jgi:hypothetical protein